MTEPERSPLSVARSFVGARETGPNQGDIVRRSLAWCTRDGRLVGIQEGDWCAGFIGLTDHEAGERRFPWRAAVWELVQDARDAGRWRDVNAYHPLPGDLAVFRRGKGDPREPWNEGHVERVEDSPNPTGWLTTIGGNVRNAVTRRTWRIDGWPIGADLVGWIVRTGMPDVKAIVDVAVDKFVREAMETEWKR